MGQSDDAVVDDGLPAVAASFQAMADNVPGALFRYRQSPDGRDAVEYMSPCCIDLWEVPAARIEHDASVLWAMVDPADLPAMRASVMASARDLSPWHHEWRITTPSGRRKWLEGRGQPQRQPDGGLLWNSLILDVTERRRTEEELHVKEAAIASALNGIALASLDGRLTYVNPAFCRLWRTTLERALGRSVVDFWQMPTHPREVIEALQRDGRWAGEMRAVREDGSAFDLEVAATMVTGPDGQPLCMMGSFSDVSERNRAQAALRALNSQLERRVAERTEALERARADAERANRAKSDFLARMSHELRTPMNAVLGFAQLLAISAALPARERDHVQEILRAGRHLLELINEVLDLARVEAGRIDLSSEPVELAPLVDETIALLAPLAAGRRITLARGIGGIAGAVRADRTRLKQVLINLGSNAVKYTHEGGTVEISAQARDGDRMRLAVRDDGPGIDPARLPDLFQPFNRLDADPGVEGAGIGLAISRRLVELMGGTLEVDSRPGQGATFAVLLPLAPLPGSPPQARPDARTAGAAAVTGAVCGRVLVVDDNPSNIKLVTEMLARRPGLQLQMAHMGQLALDLARAQRPSLVLLDLQLPDLDGWQVLQRLRADPSLADLRVVAVTSQGTPRDIERGRRAGFDAYLVKPVAIDELLAVVDQLVGACA
jgi:PAS domain S-box-containing protein